jgi:hypothetical protein
VLLEISITKEYLEVVHFYKIKDKNVRKLEEKAFLTVFGKRNYRSHCSVKGAPLPNSTRP